MKFTHIYDKFSLLLRLSSISSRKLAMEVNIDPSMISRIKSGDRRVDASSPYIIAMVDYLVKKLSLPYQREELSAAMGLADPSELADKDNFRRLLLDWLSDDGKQMSPSHSAAEHYIAYGNEGRRRELKDFIDYVSALKSPCEIYITTEQSLDWITEEPDFYDFIRRKYTQLAKRGFKLKRIIFIDTDKNDILGAVKLWSPALATGNVELFYYPHKRDKLYRVTMFIAVGHICLASTSVTDSKAVPYMSYSRNKDFLSSCTGEFEAYLEKCKPLMFLYELEKNYSAIDTMFNRIYGGKDDILQKSCSLSAITIPKRVLDIAVKKSKRTNSYVYEKVNGLAGGFENRVADMIYTDIISIFSLKRIVNCEIPLSPIITAFTGPVFYDAATYANHIRNIIDIMKKRENYNVVISRENDFNPIGATVNGENEAVLYNCSAHPLMLLNVDEPENVKICRKYITQMYISENIKRDKRDVISELSVYADQLESVAGSKL